MRIRLWIMLGIVMGFLIVNCGKQTTYTYQTVFQLHTEVEFTPYIERFEKEWGRSVSGLYIEYKDTIYNNKEYIGLCEWFPGNPHVYIQKSYWSYATKSQKEQLLFHELGHCYLFRMHRDERNLETHQPLSIMHSDAQVSEGFYWLNHDYYMNELFDR